MKITSEFTQDESFRPYKVAIHVETKNDQDNLRSFLEHGRDELHRSSHVELCRELLQQLEG